MKRQATTWNMIFATYTSCKELVFGRYKDKARSRRDHRASVPSPCGVRVPHLPSTSLCASNQEASPSSSVQSSGGFNTQVWWIKHSLQPPSPPRKPGGRADIECLQAPTVYLVDLSDDQAPAWSYLDTLPWVRSLSVTEEIPRVSEAPSQKSGTKIW